MAENGYVALEKLKAFKPDLVLMDIQMPVMDGLEATKSIRQGDSTIKNIPIIAVTADVMESTKERVKEIGMNFFISKPVNKELLFNTIKELA